MSKLQFAKKTRFFLETITVGDLFKLATPIKDENGDNTPYAVLSTAAGLLQRKLQTDAWDNHRRQSYLNTVIQGLEFLDKIIVVPANLLLQGLINDHARTIEKERKTALAQEIEEIRKDVAGGVKNYIIDGQNRILNAIVPFINNEFPLGATDIPIVDENGKVVEFAQGKHYNELHESLQDAFLNIELLYMVAEEGDIQELVNALIAKNEGYPWTEWQKMITRFWFSTYRRQLSSILDDKIAITALRSLSGKTYSEELAGHELFLSEVFYWIAKGTQPSSSKIGAHELMFTGMESVTKTQVDQVRRYLREFALGMKTMTSAKTYNNVMVRNYIYFRYQLDNRVYTDITTPLWKIKDVEAFVKEYDAAQKSMREDPDGRITHDANGVKLPTPTKVPNGFFWACSEIKDEFIRCRVELLCKKFIENEEHLKNDNIVIDAALSVSMPQKEVVWEANNRKDSKGNRVSVRDLNNLDRGHIVSKHNGGSNSTENLVLQDSGENRSMGSVNLT